MAGLPALRECSKRTPGEPQNELQLPTTEYGSCPLSMSDILNNLGIDSDDLDWFHLAICRGMDTNLFYEKYESDSNIAKNIDEMCLSCPVISMCYEAGVEGNESGVWGGVYLTSGSIDKSKNLHKEQDLWKKLKKKNVY